MKNLGKTSGQNEILSEIRYLFNCLDAEKFPMLSGDWTWQGFCRDLDPFWISVAVCCHYQYDVTH